MKILFDTSVLIAAMIESHPKHRLALAWLIKAKNKEFEMIISDHSLLEIYSVLTSAPFKPRISPKTAFRLIDNNIYQNASIRSLEKRQYMQLIEKIAQQGFKGGIIYDAFIYESAQKAEVDKIITFNKKDFDLLNIGQKIEIISE
ncbi:MAG: PIN domain-containing protein [Calditrichaceae bacterium]|nr:PIN domain-containing protein [Calditrichaceae bacterium]RQV96685.1 MAG: PIN domain-containing protein [Calditrichota bacterium]